MASLASLHMLCMCELSCQARLRLTATLIVSCSSPLRSSARRTACGFFCEQSTIIQFHNELQHIEYIYPLIIYTVPV